MVTVKCGVLIIGSLAWDGGVRTAWRKHRLDLDQQVPVELPIRYGRLSARRTGTYTMVIDPAHAPGRALVAPCTRKLGGIADLWDEARAMWAAESWSEDFRGVGADWGCIGALFRSQNPHPIQREWTTSFRSEATPIAPVDADGLAVVPWPDPGYGDDPFTHEVLLTAATLAAETRPSASQIADAWIDQWDGWERYFFENVRHGIRTADDAAIWSRIVERSPAWLAHDDYAEAIRILENEQS